MQFIAKSEPADIAAALEPQWKFTASVYLRRHHCLLYRDDQLGVQKQVMTRRNTILFAPKERSYYFIDGVSRVFHSEERMLRTLKRRAAARSSFSLSR